MKKRHEIIALLAATAGLGMTTAADAAMTQMLKHPTEEVLTGQQTLSDQSLSRMIQLAEAKGHDRSGNANAGGNGNAGGNSNAGGKGKGGGDSNTSDGTDSSAQGNGNAQGYDRSHNTNAAGSPDKPGKGEGKGRGKGNNPS